jgi:hypothetical protein
VGVALDKKALIDGDPTARVEATVHAPLGVQDVLAYLKAKGLPVPSIDVESTVNPAKAEEFEDKA